MESEFERKAKREAVDAIERRIDHNERVRRSAAFRRSISSVASVIFGIAVLAGIVLWFRNSGSVSGLGAQIGSLVGKAKASVTGESTDGLEGNGQEGTDELERKLRDRYVELTQRFMKGQLALWKAAPASVKPKGAAEGAVYYVMVPQKSGFTLYEMRKEVGGRMEIVECSPFGAALKVDQAEFRRSCEGKAYFIEHGGAVYVSGSNNLNRMETLRKTLLKMNDNNTMEELLP